MLPAPHHCRWCHGARVFPQQRNAGASHWRDLPMSIAVANVPSPGGRSTRGSASCAAPRIGTIEDAERMGIAARGSAAGTCSCKYDRFDRSEMRGGASRMMGGGGSARPQQWMYNSPDRSHRSLERQWCKTLGWPDKGRHVREWPVTSAS